MARGGGGGGGGVLRRGEGGGEGMEGEPHVGARRLPLEEEEEPHRPHPRPPPAFPGQYDGGMGPSKSACRGGGECIQAAGGGEDQQSLR